MRGLAQKQQRPRPRNQRKHLVPYNDFFTPRHPHGRNADARGVSRRLRRTPQCSTATTETRRQSCYARKQNTSSIMSLDTLVRAMVAQRQRQQVDLDDNNLRTGRHEKQETATKNHVLQRRRATGQHRSPLQTLRLSTSNTHSWCQTHSYNTNRYRSEQSLLLKTQKQLIVRRYSGRRSSCRLRQQPGKVLEENTEKTACASGLKESSILSTTGQSQPPSRSFTCQTEAQVPATDLPQLLVLNDWLLVEAATHILFGEPSTTSSEDGWVLLAPWSDTLLQ